jgi:hypothetical protein
LKPQQNREILKMSIDPDSRIVGYDQCPHCDKAIAVRFGLSKLLTGLAAFFVGLERPHGGMADAADLKSAGTTRAGSSPAEGTTHTTTGGNAEALLNAVDIEWPTKAGVQKKPFKFEGQINTRMGSVRIVQWLANAPGRVRPMPVISYATDMELTVEYLNEAMQNPRYSDVELR